MASVFNVMAPEEKIGMKMERMSDPDILMIQIEQLEDVKIVKVWATSLSKIIVDAWA
jgi:hypothetical protein